MSYGELEYLGPADLQDALVDAVRAHAGEGRSHCTRVELQGESLWLKGSAFRGKTRWRHGLRRTLLRRPAPRLAEFENLTWLREHGFGAPEPLAAGVFTRGLLPTYQFLATRDVPGAVTLRAWLAHEQPPDRRTAVAAELGREIARLHELGFLHRDLFPRNILVTGEGRPTLHFLDAWRGGVHRQLRGPAYDLACLFLHGAAWLQPGEQERLLASYLAYREDGPEPEAFLTRIARERNALVRRWHRSGGRLDLPHPQERWLPPPVTRIRTIEPS